MAHQRCHCGREASYADCCGRFIGGDSLAPTAESLMRSRYSAFVTQDEPYLLATWHPDSRPSRVSFNPDQRWLGLSIRDVSAGRPGDHEGVVEFVARSKRGGRARRLHERSRFRFDGARWLYVDGDDPRED